MKVAVIGSTGQLGTDLMKVFGNSAISLTHKDIEVSDLVSCECLLEINPDVIINTAAFHNVGACEEDPVKTFNVNSVGALNIAKIAKKIDAVNVYISTDYVFDGNKGEPYIETDSVNPVNVYGCSKVAGEYFTKNYCDKYYICRVASLFGEAGASGKGGNFVETMIKKAKAGEEIKVIDDMIMSPTYTFDAAKAISEMLNQSIPFGIYHVVNEGNCSWFDFAKTIFEQMDMDIDVGRIKTEELNMNVVKPMNSSLDAGKLSSFNISMQTWQDALYNYLHDKKYVMKRNII